MGPKSSMTILWLMPRGKLSEKKGYSSYRAPSPVVHGVITMTSINWTKIDGFHWYCYNPYF